MLSSLDFDRSRYRMPAAVNREGCVKLPRMSFRILADLAEFCENAIELRTSSGIRPY